MTQPPTLDYESRSRPPRWAAPCFASLLMLGLIYAIYALAFFFSNVNGSSFTSLDLFAFPLGAISGIVFIAAAIRLRRHTRFWAGIALVTTLLNLLALLSCVGWSFFARGITDPEDLIGFGVAIVPTAVLVVLALMLSALLKELKAAS
jgi:hypothetical protein